jgi:hypothetical protein
MGLYQYVRSQPAGSIDPSGLKWKITRKTNQATALATPQWGDTFADLARDLKLNEREILKWLTWSCTRIPAFTVPESGYADVRINGSILECCEFRVPNVALYHLGDSYDWNGMGPLSSPIFKHFKAIQEASAKADEAQGYKVEIVTGANNATITGALAARTSPNYKDLHKYYFYGHGSKASDGIINAENDQGVIPDKYTNYGLAEMQLHACGSVAATDGQIWYTGANGQPVILTQPGAEDNTRWRTNVSAQGTLTGYVGRVNNLNKDELVRSFNGLYVPR